MDLKTYTANPDRRRRLADALGTSTDYLYQLAVKWRDRRPSPELAQAIEKATEGKVSKSSLRPDLWPPEPARSRAKQRAAA